MNSTRRITVVAGEEQSNSIGLATKLATENRPLPIQVAQGRATFSHDLLGTLAQPSRPRISTWSARTRTSRRNCG
jgi:hypothetical protein